MDKSRTFLKAWKPMTRPYTRTSKMRMDLSHSKEHGIGRILLMEVYNTTNLVGC